MLGVLSKIKNGARTSNGDQLLEMLGTGKESTANVVGNIPNYEKISSKVHTIYQNKGTSIWILDSGASNHIVCDFFFLTTSKPTHNHFVKLPNETKLKVFHIGMVTFTSEFILHNVLCVPDFLSQSHLNQ